MISRYTLFLLLYALPFSSANWLSNILPQPGTTPTDQIKCYALPYGGIGFATHILTYYTAAMLTFGRSPWRFSRIRHTNTDLWLAGVSLPLTVIPSIITMVRCRSRWVFYLLAGWKLSLSLMLGLTAITTACNVKRGRQRPVDYALGAYRVMTHRGNDGNDKYEISVVRTFLWLTIYAVGTIMGIVGLGVLVHDAWVRSDFYKTPQRQGVYKTVNIVCMLIMSQYIPKLRHLSYGFIAVVGFLGLVVGFLEHHSREESRFRGGLVAAIFVALATFGVGAVIYSDWALAIIAGNLVGIPDGNNFWVNFFFWTYFFAKRLPMFSL